MIGERTNVTGSRRFAHLIRDENYEEALKSPATRYRVAPASLDINMDDALARR